MEHIAFDDGKFAMESAPWRNPLDVHQQHTRQFRELQEDYCEVMLDLRKRKNYGPDGR